MWRFVGDKKRFRVRQNKGCRRSNPLMTECLLTSLDAHRKNGDTSLLGIPPGAIPERQKLPKQSIMHGKYEKLQIKSATTCLCWIPVAGAFRINNQRISASQRIDASIPRGFFGFRVSGNLLDSSHHCSRCKWTAFTRITWHLHRYLLRLAESNQKSEC